MLAVKLCRFLNQSGTNSSRSTWSQLPNRQHSGQCLPSMQNDGDYRIQASCRKNELDTALGMLQGMTTAADNESYLAILKLCAKCKSTSRAQQVYAHIRSHVNSIVGILGDYLVVALAKCGAVDDAYQIFENLSQRTIFSWNAIISAYVEFEDSEEIFTIFERMLLDDVEPDTYTYVSLFKACGKSMNLALGRKLHSAACEQGSVSDVFVVSTLISMYGKVGHIIDAEAVFCRIFRPNTVPWNAMLSAYVQQVKLEETIRLFRQMLEEGVEVDHHTLVFALQACCGFADSTMHLEQPVVSVTALEIGHALHAYAWKKNFATGTFVGTALLSMYGKYGAVTEAENVFITLSQPNLVSWNAMLSTFVDHGRAKEALHLYKQMHQDGLQPNELTYAMSLQACGILAEREEGHWLEGKLLKLDSLQIGKALHRDVHANGLASDTFVGTALVNMYGKCNTVAEAETVFLSLSQHDVVAWNAMMAAYLDQSEAMKALRAYRQISEEDIVPGKVTFVLALQACGAAGDIDEGLFPNEQSIAPVDIGKALHADARKKGFLSDMMVGNTIVSMYGKCGSIFEAEHLCGTTIHRNVVTWNAMLSAYVEQLQGVKALLSFVRMLKEGIHPNEMTFVISVQACCILAEQVHSIGGEGTRMTAAMQIGQALHEDAEKRGFTTSPFIGTALLTMYGKFGAVVEAEYIFGALSQRDTVSWNALLGVYIEQDEGEKALQLFRRMEQEGARSHQQTFVIAMQACGNLAKKEENNVFVGQSTRRISFELSQALHRDAQRAGYASDTSVGNSLLSLYKKCGAILNAEDVFNEILHPDLVSWNALISVCLEQNQGDKVLHIYKQIRKQHLVIDDVTLACILQACSSTGSLDLCKSIHFGAVSAGYDHIASVAVALVHAYGSSSSMLNAEAFSDELPEPDLVVWNACLSGHASGGNHAICLQMLESLTMGGFQPDALTYTSLLSACSHAGFVDTGLQHFERMKKDNLALDLRHYGTVLDMLGRAGDFRRAHNLLREMPIQANSAIWLSVLGACRTHNNLQLGQRAFENAVAMAPENSSAYVMMSDIYAQI